MAQAWAGIFLTPRTSLPLPTANSWKVGPEPMLSSETTVRSPVLRSTRRIQAYSNYRRFVGAGRVVE